jgi:pyruvate/2-oxoglutarate dehydrogenase complex dihydrolipoamide dehydrogenase (E3) component
METFDVAIIGGGTAGPSAARNASERGLSVAVIEADRFGGDCLWWACVPTKALLECARIYQLTKRSRIFGTLADNVRLDFGLVQARKNDIIGRIAANDDPKHLEDKHIRIIRGRASFESSHELRVGDQVIRAQHIVLAIGSVPEIPPIPGLDQVDYLTNLTVINLTELPRSMVILGAGPVGCEFAQMFARFGSQVTLVQRNPRLLPREDDDSSALARAVLEEEGVTILTGASVRQVEKSAGQVTLKLESADGALTVSADQLLVATGRRTPLQQLNAEAAGLGQTAKGLEVSDTLQTTVPHIWACGDAAGKMLFTHVAEHQGYQVGRNIGAAQPERWEGRVVPRATFLEPEIASVGLTEREAAASYEIVTGMVPFSASDRAVMQDETRGFVKFVVNRPDGQILGAHIVGPSAGELIHELALAMAGGVAVRHVGSLIHLYPSLLDPLRWAAQAAESKRGTRIS